MFDLLAWVSTSLAVIDKRVVCRHQTGSKKFCIYLGVEKDFLRPRLLKNLIPGPLDQISFWLRLYFLWLTF